MLEKPELPQDKPQSPATDASRVKAREISKSIRQTLQQATKLKDLSFQAALDMANASGSIEESQEARARAQAIIALTKSWSEACNMIRIARGKPLPGSLRPESKPTKRKQQPSMFTENKPE